MEGGEPRSREEIRRLRAGRGGLWPLIRRLRQKRVFLTAGIVLGALVTSIVTDAEPADLLDPSGSWRFWTAWPLMLLGLLVRVWGAGNLRKNKELTSSGIYRLVRHPLYFGNLSLFLAYFLTVGDPLPGVLWFVALVSLAYLPTMMDEEEYLTLKFPGEFQHFRPPPRLVPDLSRFPEAIRTDQFELRKAYRNFGFRTIWFLVGLPVFLRLLAWLTG